MGWIDRRAGMGVACVILLFFVDGVSRVFHVG